jgi:hypothetical protein
MASLSFIQTGKLADLLRSADPGRKMYVRVMSTTRLALGADPLTPTHVIDLSKETIGQMGDLPSQISTAMPDDATSPSIGSKFTRRGGDYWFELKGKRIECGSLKQLLAEGLKALEKANPSTLDNLARHRGRSRRIVARDRNQLYDKQHLVKDYTEPLIDGWFYGTNNSARETNVWLQRAAECAGLKWGTEFNTNLEPIVSIDDL